MSLSASIIDWAIACGAPSFLFDAFSLIPELAPALPIVCRRSWSWRRSTRWGPAPDAPDAPDDRLLPTPRALRFTVLLRRSVSGRSLSGVLLIDESRMIFISRTVGSPAQLSGNASWKHPRGACHLPRAAPQQTWSMFGRLSVSFAILMSHMSYEVLHVGPNFAQGAVYPTLPNPPAKSLSLTERNLAQD